ncbi:glycosyltransferase family 2 protein [Qipengyuania qiaonensis]|uniref:Glycosyltransferase n=1 Tax=Qipengyuania qiaonensis TaxID=2867240 RepID=A0ABS7JD68_9SPHN|nr:glycosyltransferase family A protein [Qipengyuania qiaonensis]MBX7483643.1 glycosyltransferase [Qipengyuania qiaonensis]
MICDESKPVVAIVIPAFDAEATITETLESVRAQSWPALDIVVVDDGSSDRTTDLVEQQAREDGRIRLIRQENGGVAAARNRGAQSSNAPFIAFLDADDVWAREKIAAQMALVQDDEGNPQLVYCWFAQIDRHSTVYPVGNQRIIEGDVLEEISRSNFVGNGSSLLVPREIFDRIGGFDAGLRENDAQGCEDLLFLALASRHYRFRVVPRHLLGYRLSHGSMSASVDRMLRSFDFVAERIIALEGGTAAAWAAHRKDLIRWLAGRAAMGGRVGIALNILGRMGPGSVGDIVSSIPELARTYFRAVVVPGWLKRASRSARIMRRRPRYLDIDW